MAHGHFVFEDCRMGTSACVDDTVILNIGAIANSYVVHVAAQDCVTPNGRLLTEVNVTNHLGAHINIRARGNLRMNTAKRSNHIFAQ